MAPASEKAEQNGALQTRLIHLLVLVVVTAAVYLGCLDADFVALDDDVYITSNRAIQRGLSWDTLVMVLRGEFEWNWHPITWLSHMIDCEIHGLHAPGHHLTSLMLHLLNVGLLYGLLSYVGHRPWRSFWVALVFAVHPLDAEVVAWVSARKDLLSASFGLLTIWAYSAHARRPSLRRYLAVIALYTCGLLSKPVLVTLPFGLLLWDYWPLRRLTGDRSTWRRPIVEKIPLLLLAGTSAIITFNLQRSIGTVSPLEGLSLGARMSNVVVSYVEYLGKLLWPTDLHVLYPHPELAGGQSLPGWHVALAAGVLVTITAAFLRSRYKPLVSGWLWFLGTLVPVIGLVQIGAQSMADRYAYWTTWPLVTGIVWALCDSLGPKTRPWLALVAAMLALALAWRGRQQVAVWHDTTTLFEHALSIEPDNYMLQFRYGSYWHEQGKPRRAAEHYAHALRLDASSPDLHNDLAIALFASGERRGALRHFRAATTLAPDRVAHQVNYAQALRLTGQRQEALDVVRGARRQHPNDAKLAELERQLQAE